MKRTDPIEWKTNDPGAAPRVAVNGPSDRVLWLIFGKPGMTSITLPAPPSSAGEALATAGQSLIGRVMMCAEFDKTRWTCNRWASSKAFSIEAPSTKTATTTGRLTDFRSMQPVDAVKVCVKDEPAIPCATSDATGYFVLPRLPVDKDVILILEKTGYFTTAIHRGKELTTYYELQYPAMALRSMQATWESKLGEALDPQKGPVVVAAAKGAKPASGVTFTVSPTAKVTYGDDTDWPAPSLTATSSAGWAVISNVAAGPYEVTAKIGSTPCAVGFAWKGSTADAAKVTSIPDTLSGIAFVCP
jgi:hypothetical protein